MDQKAICGFPVNTSGIENNIQCLYFHLKAYSKN